MESVRQAIAVLFVLGALAGTLFWLRRRGLATVNLKGIGRTGGRRLRALERLPLTPQHSLHLVAIGKRVVLIAVSPGGCTLLEGDWELPEEQQGVRG